MNQEVIEHSSYSIHQCTVTEYVFDFSGYDLQGVDGIIAHDVVEPRKHPQLAEHSFLFLSLLLFQLFPLPSLLCFLFLFDLSHVLKKHITVITARESG